ncbi:MAG TPA: hypothetical protein VNO14_17705 [Blastocatellia bacterium]|nr:hypothetical protein [Blastocatellia bacterium]
MLRSKLLAVLTLLSIAALAGRAHPAQEQEENDPARAQALIEGAIKARGGAAYLGVRRIVSQGQYTQFEKGVSGLPQSFIDYIVYPDRERTEFGKGDHKFIQTNSGDSGWIYDAPQKMIRDQTDEQIKNFQQGIRHDLDNLLRLSWKEPGAKLVYLGRREAWRNTFSEAIRIDFADGNSVTLHFDTRSKLPLMTEYKSVVEDKTTDNQIRYFRWVDFNGIKFPTIQDFYREGQQTARVAYDSVQFNEEVPEKLFEKPASIKEVK